VNVVTDSELGARISTARRRAGLTQAQVGEALAVSRATVIATEQGRRRPVAEELTRIAAVLQVSLHDLLKPHAVRGEVSPRFRAGRAARDAGGQLDAAAEQLRTLAVRYAELERLLGHPPRVNTMLGLPVTRSASARSSVEARRLGEDAADHVRRLLGLGDAPIADLVALADVALGARIFHLELPSSVAGILIFGDELGCCIALHAGHPATRRAWSLAHELGHAVDDAEAGDVLPVAATGRVDPAEAFADGFACGLLLPTTRVRWCFSERRRVNGGAFSAIDVANLARQFGVSLEAMARRLEDLELLPRGTWDMLRGAGLKASALGAPERGPRPERFPLRYLELAAVAFERGLVSEGELARLLEVDRLEARGRYLEIKDQLVGTVETQLGVDLLEAQRAS